ncbi:MAG TPA: hypothetical protein PLU43_10005, partial [Lachnospiraceae bacterium]|nr:hypothetical protein [Lachnospiraceae bacterium]
MNFLVKIKDLLYKDVSSENELKEMAVLLRVLCITDAVFYTISAIVLFLIFGSKEGVFSLVFVLIMLIILRTTYKNSTRISLFLYSFILAMIVIFYCALFGTQIGYQFSLYTVILLFFYKTDESTAFKMSSSIVCGLLAVVTSVYIDIVGPVNQLKNSQEVVLLCIYSLWLLSKIIIISRFYCLKFSASEDKIIQ